MIRFFIGVVAALALSCSAFAQGPGGGVGSGPGPGPTPYPWAISGNKVLLPAGQEIVATPSAAASAGFNLPQGVAPTSPQNGDFWTTSFGIFVRLNGVTIGPLGPGGSSGQVQTNNGSGGFAGLTNAQLTALINPATAALPGALPAWPNNTTTFFRGDGSYAAPSWSAITGTPTTLAGYGITNARTQLASNTTFYVNGNSATTNATTAAGSNTLHFAGGSGATNATTAAGSNTLHFAVVPASIYFGATISDATASVVPANTTVTGITKTTVTLSANVTGGGVGSGDTIQWSFHAFKVGMGIANGTANIPAGTTISSITPTTTVLSANVTGAGVANGDTFVAQATCGLTGAETCGFGNDANDCLSAATACLTLQRVANLIGFTYDLAGFGVTVSLAHGASTNYAVSFTEPVVGNSTWSIFGDQNAPTAVTILSPASNAAVFVKDLGTLGLINLSFFNNPAGTGVGYIHAGVGSPGGIDATNLTFGALSTGSVFSTSYTGSRITVGGTCILLGDVPIALNATLGGLIDVSGASCSGVSGLSFSAVFANESGGGIINPNASSWISAFPSATGPRFSAQDVAAFGGNDPNTLFPGNVNGIVAPAAFGMTSGNFVSVSGGVMIDSGIATTSLAPKVSPTFSGTVTFPGSGTATSSGFANIKALGVNRAVPSTGNVDISGVYMVSGAQITAGSLSNGVTGSGAIVLATAPSVSALTVTGSFTAAGLVTNADLANPATTVAGQTCTLGSTCGLSSTSNAITVDVALNNTANYFDGPSIAQGTIGTWKVHGQVTLTVNAGDTIRCKLWDGTTVIAATQVGVGTSVQNIEVPLSGFLASPAANIKISCRNITSTTTTAIAANASANGNKDSTLFGERIN